MQKSVELVNDISGKTEKVSVSSFETNKNYDFINNGNTYKFNFDNGKISKITLN